MSRNVDAFVLWLDEVDTQHLSLVGRKAAILGELLSLGIPVPYGFVITDYAFRRFLRINSLDEKIQHFLDVLSSEKVQNLALLSNLSNKIKVLLEGGRIPQEVKREIICAYNRLRESFWPEIAVRSSAVLEDAPNASFAGQLKSFIGIHNIDGLIECIKKCWSSAFSLNCILYAERMGVRYESIHIGVCVQVMIKSRSSGVVFTANPISKSTDEMIIESAWGFGLGVVSGLITPDIFIVDKTTLRIVDRRISKKREGYFWDASLKQIIRKELDNAMSLMPSLTDKEVKDISALAIDIETHFGRPQDIEWCIEKGSNRLFILQSRPITTI